MCIHIYEALALWDPRTEWRLPRRDKNALDTCVKNQQITNTRTERENENI